MFARFTSRRTGALHDGGVGDKSQSSISTNWKYDLSMKTQCYQLANAPTVIGRRRALQPTTRIHLFIFTEVVLSQTHALAFVTIRAAADREDVQRFAETALRKAFANGFAKGSRGNGFTVGPKN